MGIYRLGFTEVKTPDLELCAAYYTEVLGLREVDRVGDCIYLKCWDEHDHHSLVLRYAPRYGIEQAGWKVESLDDLEHFETKAERWGCHVERLAEGDLHATGPGIRFETPSGHTMVLYYKMKQVGNGLPKTNPPPMPLDLNGIAPKCLDHCLLTTENIGEAARFMKEVLGFRLTEQVVSNEGHQLAAFLERTCTTHDVAFVKGSNGGLHHVSFWLDDMTDVYKAADILRLNGVDIEIGPTRHGISRGHTIYFFDPVGNRNEVFTGGYWVDPVQWEPITWTEDQIGKAIFYFEGRLIRSFHEVHS
ncbi:MAG: catechol 2,3-dioxygenase [Myxococcota bacterium]